MLRRVDHVPTKWANGDLAEVHIVCCIVAEVSNDGIEPDMLSARKEREAKSADGFRKVAASITS